MNYTRINHLSECAGNDAGKKMEEFPHEQDEVLLLLERITESQRLAAAQLRETEKDSKGGGKSGKRKYATDDIDDAELLVQRALKKKVKKVRK